MLTFAIAFIHPSIHRVSKKRRMVGLVMGLGWIRTWSYSFINVQIRFQAGFLASSLGLVTPRCPGGCFAADFGHVICVDQPG